MALKNVVVVELNALFSSNHDLDVRGCRFNFVACLPDPGVKLCKTNLLNRRDPKGPEKEAQSEN